MEPEWSDISEGYPVSLHTAHRVLVSIPNLPLSVDKLPACLVNCQHHRYRSPAVNSRATTALCRNQRQGLADHIFEWQQDRNDDLPNLTYLPVVHPRLRLSNLYIHIQ